MFKFCKESWSSAWTYTIFTTKLYKTLNDDRKDYYPPVKASLQTMKEFKK